MRKFFCFTFVICLHFNCMNVLAIDLQFGIDDNDESKVGRIDILDEVIVQPNTLKAIAFSTIHTTKPYKAVLYDALDELEKRIESIKDEKLLENANYYKYVIENVIKYTNKWLNEEVLHLIDKTNDKSVEVVDKWKAKRNIAEFIYYTSGDYGMELVMNNKDISFDNGHTPSNTKEAHEDL